MKKEMQKGGDKEIIKPVRPAKEPIKKLTKTQIEQALIENFVSLQKVLANLSVKFDNLSDNISKLLQLFEISAKSFMEKQGIKSVQDVERDKEFLNKLNMLIDQNKTLARGLTLMGEKVRERIQSQSSQEEIEQFPLFSSKQPQQQRMPEPGNYDREDTRLRPRPLPQS